MSSVRIANSYLSGALEVAAEYIQNGVRRATNDCVRKTPKVPVVPLGATQASIRRVHIKQYP